MRDPSHMNDAHPITSLVLEEFRLRDVDVDGTAASIVAAFSQGSEPPVPLLTSIDDRRDVATVRALRGDEMTDPAERAALGPLVASWQAVKRYGPRIAERSDRSPSYYRLAVTESGINDPGPRAGTETLPADGETVPISLLWIGKPAGAAGLMVLVGNDERPEATSPEPQEWPLPLSDRLGVRVYELRR
jgi:hypothetical protein